MAEEVKAALRLGLEHNGVWQQLQAQVRSELFHLVEGQAAEPRPPVSEANTLVNALVREYLAWNAYLHTESVFAVEASLPKEPLSRDVLTGELNLIDDPSTRQVPLLYAIVELLRQHGLPATTRSSHLTSRSDKSFGQSFARATSVASVGSSVAPRPRSPADSVAGSSKVRTPTHGSIGGGKVGVPPSASVGAKAQSPSSSIGARAGAKTPTGRSIGARVRSPSSTGVGAKSPTSSNVGAWVRSPSVGAKVQTPTSSNVGARVLSPSSASGTRGSRAALAEELRSPPAKSLAASHRPSNVQMTTTALSPNSASGSSKHEESALASASSRLSVASSVSFVLEDQTVEHGAGSDGDNSDFDARDFDDFGDDEFEAEEEEDGGGGGGDDTRSS